MKREFIKALNIEALTDDIIDNIMTEHGKTVKSTADKLETANKEIGDWKTKYGEIETKLKSFDGVNVEELRGQIAQLSGEIETNKTAYESERSKDKRVYETNEFLNGYKFVNEYTKKAFADNLNGLLDDKANEGKNRKDLFDALIKDSDGKETENQSVKLNTVGFPQNPLPASGKAPDTSGIKIPLSFQPVRAIPNNLNANNN